MHGRGAQIAQRIVRCIEVAAASPTFVQVRVYEDCREFAHIFADMCVAIKEAQQEKKQRAAPLLTTQQRAWLMCVGMCAGVRIVRWMRRMQTTRSTRVIASKALELLRSNEPRLFFSGSEGEMRDDAWSFLCEPAVLEAQAKFMDRLMRLVFKVRCILLLRFTCAAALLRCISLVRRFTAAALHLRCAAAL